jgi:hypothetical protein
MELKSISCISGVIDDGMVTGMVVVIVGILLVIRFVVILLVNRFATLVVLVICPTKIR